MKTFFILLICDLQQQINEALKTWEKFFHARSLRERERALNGTTAHNNNNKKPGQARSFILRFIISSPLLFDESINSI